MPGCPRRGLSSVTRQKSIVATMNAQNAAAGARNRTTAWRPADRKPRHAASNQDLAPIARDRAARAPVGTAERKAWGCLAVALSTTGSLAGTRRVLSVVAQADIRNHANQLLDQLAKEASR